MNNKELNELLEYNQEYMEARLSEDVFGGDYTSEIELKYLQKDYDKLQFNWNSLRECIIKRLDRYDRLVSKEEGIEIEILMWVRDKMNELESGDKN